MFNLFPDATLTNKSFVALVDANAALNNTKRFHYRFENSIYFLQEQSDAIRKAHTSSPFLLTRCFLSGFESIK